MNDYVKASWFLPRPYKSSLASTSFSASSFSGLINKPVDEHGFPKLASLAKTVFCIPTISVSCERLQISLIVSSATTTVSFSGDCRFCLRMKKKTFTNAFLCENVNRSTKTLFGRYL